MYIEWNYGDFEGKTTAEIRQKQGYENWNVFLDGYDYYYATIHCLLLKFFFFLNPFLQIYIFVDLITMDKTCLFVF